MITRKALFQGGGPRSDAHAPSCEQHAFRMGGQGAPQRRGDVEVGHGD